MGLEFILARDLIVKNFCHCFSGSVEEKEDTEEMIMINARLVTWTGLTDERGKKG